jgi:hypothetical protein
MDNTLQKKMKKIHNKLNDIWLVTFLKNYYHPELVKNHCIW